LSVDERKKFDAAWDFEAPNDLTSDDNNIEIRSSLIVTLKNMISKKINQRQSFRTVATQDLTELQTELQRELIFFKDNLIPNDKKSDRLIYLFLTDVLAGLNGKIVDMKTKRESSHTRTVSKFKKYLGWGVYLALNAGMLFYVYLFAIQQSENMQFSWFLSFIMWISFQVILVSSGIVFFLHIFIPSLAKKEVDQAKSKLAIDLTKFKKSLVTNNISCENSNGFNAASFFFVSNKLAKAFPELPESQLILNFRTLWPKTKKNYTIQNSYKKSYKSFISHIGNGIVMILVSSFIVLPSQIQETVLESVLSAGAGYFIISLARLYHINIFLPFVPVVILIVMVHFYISSKSTELSETLKEAGSVYPSSIPEITLVRDGDLNVQEFNANNQEQLVKFGQSATLRLGCDRFDIDDDVLFHLSEIEEESSKYVEF